jgi:hypothetical protein
MGGMVDHSSNLPNLVALSSAKVEYNEGYIAFMAATHLKMLLCELEGVEESAMEPAAIYFDSKSAIAMGKSDKDTKHTHHIMRRCHYTTEAINSNRFVMRWISTEFQIANIGTKSSPGPRFTFLVNLIYVKVKDQHRLIREGG